MSSNLTASAKSIGITRFFGNATALLPKSLPKLSYEVAFLLASVVCYRPIRGSQIIQCDFEFTEIWCLIYFLIKVQSDPYEKNY